MLGMIAVLIGIALIIELYIDHNVLTIAHYDISHRNIGKAFEGMKLLQISDLHCKSFGKDNQKLIQKVQDEHPDIIVMTGDLISDGKLEAQAFQKLIEGLVTQYPIYFVKGNHEENLPKQDLEKLMAYLKKQGVIVLDNEKSSIQKDNDKINIYGIDGYLKSYYSQKEKRFIFTENTMKKVMHIDKAEKGVFNILLAHNPNFIEGYTKWGADLILSGHIHGGLVRLPLIGGVFSPDTMLFPKYSKGEYIVNEKTLIVSTGLDRGSRGVRLFNRPQINVITLHEKNHE